MPHSIMTGGPQFIGELNRADNFPVQEESAELRDLRLKKACSDFEAIFVYQLLEIMRKTVPEGGLLSGKGGLGNSTYQMLFDQKLAEALTSQGKGLGIQHTLYRQLKNSGVKD